MIAKQNERMAEETLDAKRRRMADISENYEAAREDIDSGKHVERGRVVAAEIFAKLLAFDSNKYQPPSVEPYRLIWECQQGIRELTRTLDVVEEYEGLKSAVAEISQSLAPREGN
jgi:hypothetical protein